MGWSVYAYLTTVVTDSLLPSQFPSHAENIRHHKYRLVPFDYSRFSDVLPWLSCNDTSQIWTWYLIVEPCLCNLLIQKITTEGKYLGNLFFDQLFIRVPCVDISQATHAVRPLGSVCHLRLVLQRPSGWPEHCVHFRHTIYRIRYESGSKRIYNMSTLVPEAGISCSDK